MGNDQILARVLSLPDIPTISSGMAYIVIKTVKGRQYRYQQRSYREGGKVRTETVYLGPVGGGTRRQGVLRRVAEFIEINLKPSGPFIDEEAMLRDVQKDEQERARLQQWTKDFLALKLEEPLPAALEQPVQDSPGTEEAPSDETGGAKDQ